MEENNTNQQPEPLVTDKVKIKSKADNLLIRYLKLAQEKLNQVLKNLSPRNRKLLGYVTMGFAAFVFLVLVLGIIAARTRNKPANVKPTPTPISGNFTPIENPSAYANDEQIKAFDEEVVKINEKIQNTDLANSKLTPPTLDFEVEF